VTFANVIIFSIPETYVVTSAGILLIFRVFLDERWFATLDPLLVGTAIGVLALNNAPLLSLGIPLVYCQIALRGRFGIGRGIWSVVLMLAVFATAETLVNGVRMWTWFQEYAREWANPRHFHEPAAIAAALCGLLGFGIVSPYDALQPSMSLADAAAYSGSLPRMLALLMYVAYLVTGCLAARRRDPVRLTSLMAWTVSMVLFYIYFNPAEAILYSPQLTGIVTLILLAAHERFNGTTLGVVTPIFVLLVAWTNLYPLFPR
jgi:hypothetical protein